MQAKVSAKRATDGKRKKLLPLTSPLVVLQDFTTHFQSQTLPLKIKLQAVWRNLEATSTSFDSSKSEKDNGLEQCAILVPLILAFLKITISGVDQRLIAMKGVDHISGVDDELLEHSICKQHNKDVVVDANEHNKELNPRCIEEITDDEEAQCVPNGIKSIECFICDQVFQKIYKLRLHMQLHAHVEYYIDSNLEQSSVYKFFNPYGRNIETQVIGNFLVQEINAKRYSQFYGILNEAGVELHISDSETESESDAVNVSEAQLIPRNKYKCDLCTIYFDRRYKALFHQRTIHSRCKSFIKCDYCGRQYIGMELLIHHLKTQCESDEKPITCIDRFKQHLLRVNLEQFESLAQARKELKNRRLTTARKIYNCRVCAKTFTRSEHLTRHKAVHLPEELKFECPVCFRRFNRKDNMRSHMKVHMQEAERDKSSVAQPILCQYCGHCFTSKSNYVVHMRRHTGEKPYKCDVCGKGFPKSTDLNTHKITHSGEKNFTCNVCFKSFARSTVLSKHMRIHAGPFHCNLCVHSFPRPNELATHLRTHVSGGQACTCIVCNRNVHTQQELEEHFKLSGHNNVRVEQKQVHPLKSAQDMTINSAITDGSTAQISSCLITSVQPPAVTLSPQSGKTVDIMHGEVNSNVLCIQTCTSGLQSMFPERSDELDPNAFLGDNPAFQIQPQLQDQHNTCGTWQLCNP